MQLSPAAEKLKQRIAKELAGLSKDNDHLSKWWAIIIGAGVAVIPIHNRWLTELCTTSGGSTILFLPSFGYVLMIAGTGAFVLANWKKIAKLHINRYVFFPLLVIAAAISISGVTGDGIAEKLAPLCMTIAFIGIYLVSSIIGKTIFVPLAVGAAIASVGVAISGIIHPGDLTGGLVFEGNYDIVVGYVLLGTALFAHHHQWILASAALAAMFISGSPEGVFSVAVLGATIAVRRDFGRKLVYAVIPTIIVAAIWFSIGWGQELYGYARDILTNDATPTSHTGDYTTTTIGYRLEVIEDSMTSLNVFGEGFEVLNFKPDTVHNVPLIIVQQLGIFGIVAGAAWLWVILYGILRTRYKYAFVLLLSLSVFDHFVWTQMAPVIWILGGLLNHRDYLSGDNNDELFTDK